MAISLHAYIKMPITPLYIMVFQVFKPTQSLHKAYIKPTCFCFKIGGLCIFHRHLTLRKYSFCIFPLTIMLLNSLENLRLPLRGNNCLIGRKPSNSLENLIATSLDRTCKYSG